MGLDVHDVGLKTTILRKGMVLTCEPGLYIKEEGIGIRIENDILVDDTPIDLMRHFPIEADEIEKLMKESTL
jgi:Xaa-Pro aminopeptidase